MTCPYCGSLAELVDSAVVYGRSFGPLWLCASWPECDAYVGCHKGTTQPMGELADRNTREWRRRAHDIFDRLHKSSGRLARKEAYRWLAEQLGLSIDDCHIGMFDAAMCERVVAVCRAWHERRSIA